MKITNRQRFLAPLAAAILVGATSVSTALAFEYTLLDSSILGDSAPAEITGWRQYLELAIKAFYTFLASAAIFVITVYGIKYMLSELPNVKNDAKGRIWDAIIGLVLALSAYLILQIINPALLEDNFSTSIQQTKTSEQ